MKYRLVLSCVLLYLGIWAYAQTEQVEFEHIRTEDGLPHSTINDFIQDRLGYLWIATDNGLAYYDNNQVKVYQNQKDDTNSISNNQIYKLHIDSKKNLWIGTKQSLELYDDNQESFKHFPIKIFPDKEPVPIIDIFQLNDSTLLLGTDGGGIWHFNTTTYKYKHVLPFALRNRIGNRISSIELDQYGRFWLGTLDKGIFIYTPKTAGNNSGGLLHILEGLEVRKLMNFNENELLIATYGKGILRINIDHLTHTPLIESNNPNHNTFRVFEMKRDGDLIYIGTDGEGLIQYNIVTKEMNSFKNLGTNTPSITNNVIRSIFIDQEHNLWFGHYHGGISFIRARNHFKNLKYSPYASHSLSHNNGTAILVDSKNRIWIGTDGGGLNIIENGKLHNNLHQNINQIFTGYNPPKILSLFEDKRGLIWIGTYLEGLFIYNPGNGTLKNFNTLYPELKLSNSDIRCIMQSRSGEIWLGTNGGGVNIIDMKQNTIKHIKRDEDHSTNSITLDWIRCIFEDSYGYMWIGTSYGVNVYDPVKKTFRHYISDNNDSTSISGNFIYSIIEDKSTQMWIGTSSGLNKYNRRLDNFQVITEKNGWLGNIINNIIVAKDQTLWLSSNTGLTNYSPSNHTFKKYNTTDGIACNSFINAASYNYKDSLYFFGSTAGITYFNPNEITEIEYVIPIVLTELKVLNQTISVGQVFNNRVILNSRLSDTESIELLKSENVITINFTALSYSYSDKLKYEYRLLGFSEEWNKTSIEPSVTYTNLESGEYYFQIRVSNLGIHQPIRTLKITINPPFYETWWFKLILLSIIALLGFTILKLRTNNIKNQRDILKQKYEIEKLASEKDRENFSNKISATEKRFKENELNYKNSQLISTTMLLTHKNKKMNQVKNKVSSMAKDVLDRKLKSELKNIIEVINSEFVVEKDWSRFEDHFNEVHEDFIKRLKDTYPELTLTYLRLCAYLRLNLSTKEIASLMNISQRGVEKSRSRLRKKLNLSPEVNIIRFISEI